MKSAPFSPEDYVTDWEGCFSVPLATGRVTRFREIKTTHQNEAGEKFEGQLSEWPARVWQHETDHTNGFLFDDEQAGKCVEFRAFETKEALMEFRNNQK